MKPTVNPFSLTKAVDLTDEQINSFWVDINSTGGFAKKAKPTSPMPMIIMGGKGSGKTHLMRHYAYQVQKLRNTGFDLFSSIVSEGYLGVYIRTPGLNASRFRDKSQSQAQWAALFSYYLELWFAQTLLSVFQEFITNSNKKIDNEPKLVGDMYKLFDKSPATAPETLSGFIDLLEDLRKKLDFKINNAAFSRTLDVTIYALNGKLIFGIPKLLQAAFPDLKNLVFLYLVDEYEHFDEQAQRYFNTLIREREFPVGFKIGVKLWGLKTLKTFSGDEGLKEGSEFERLILDADLRASPSVYQQFALNLCRTRLQEVISKKISDNPNDIQKFFSDANSLSLAETDWGRACARFKGTRRPGVTSLEKKLKEHAKRFQSLAVESDNQVAEIISLIEFDEDYLIEKTNCFLLYRAWYRNKPLLKAAREIREDCLRYVKGERANTAHATVLDKFEGDLRHQFIIEAEHKIDYLGLESFIAMSHGIARNLLTILRGVYDWSLFYGEEPSALVSVRAQRIAVEEASEWFFQDAQHQSDGGKNAAIATDRIGELLQAIRYSDKPSECSLRSFSVEWDGLDAQTRDTIELAEKLSFIIRDSERKERNSARPTPKFQLNRMLSPRYRLPIASRGSIHLSISEAQAIFGNPDPTSFKKIKMDRLRELNAPFSSVIKQGGEIYEFEF